MLREDRRLISLIWRMARMRWSGGTCRIIFFHADWSTRRLVGSSARRIVGSLTAVITPEQSDRSGTWSPIFFTLPFATVKTHA
jgi:hypothetical protein